MGGNLSTGGMVATGGTLATGGSPDGAADEWSFGGDIDDVFPRGKGVLNGTNIPVRAGRYEIRFNTETLEYSFVETGDKPVE